MNTKKIEIERVQFQDEVKPKFYYKFELAQMYGISLNTFSAMIKRYEEEFIVLAYRRSQKILSPIQVKRLFELIGEP